MRRAQPTSLFSLPQQCQMTFHIPADVNARVVSEGAASIKQGVDSSPPLPPPTIPPRLSLHMHTFPQRTHFMQTVFIITFFFLSLSLHARNLVSASQSAAVWVISRMSDEPSLTAR